MESEKSLDGSKCSGRRAEREERRRSNLFDADPSTDSLDVNAASLADIFDTAFTSQPDQTPPRGPAVNLIQLTII